MDKIITNGIIVTPNGLYKSNIGIKNEHIVILGEDLELANNIEIIDAKGKYILPGIVDAHVHLSLPMKGTISSDDFASGTLAAACGGVTTIIDFSLFQRGKTLHQALKERREQADKLVHIDYSLHIEIMDITPEILEEIPILIKEGLNSFKIFTAYKEAGVMLEDDKIYALMETVAANNGIVMAHCENGYLLDSFIKRLLNNANTEPIYHARSRPPLLEAESIRRLIYFAEATNCPLYIVHISSKAGFRAFYEGKKHYSNLYGETCPQYLLLDESYLKGKDAHQYIMSPPLRTIKDNKILWNGLTENILDTIATDHVAFTRSQKDKHKESFFNVPNGLTGVETLLPLLYTYGVLENNISLSQLVKFLCYNPARIFGLYPKKGTIQIGSDADLVIFDPNLSVKLNPNKLHSNTDFSPYEGLIMRGYPSMVISRGKVIYKDGEFLGKKGDGKFVKGVKNKQV